MSAASPTTTISGIDISNDSGSSTDDFVTKQATQTVTATLSAPLGAGEVLEASSDGGVSFSNISTSVTGTSVSWGPVALAGNSSLQFKVVAGGLSGPVSSQAYVLDTVAPATTVSGVDISNDTGSSASDFLTKSASQTVTATLSAPLAAGEILEASVDNGASWTTITGSVVGTAVNWTGATLLPGTDNLLLRVTDAAGNFGLASSTPYEVDTLAPGTTVSAISISDDTGVSSSDVLTKTASQTITTTLSSGLGSGEILELSVDGGVTWSDISASVTGTSVSAAAQLIGGTSSIQMRVTDAAGNYGPATALGYTLLTVAPDVTVSVTQFGNDSGTSNTDFYTKNSGQLVYGSLSSALRPNEILECSLDGGATWVNVTSSIVGGTGISLLATLLPGSNTLQLRVSDEAGNTGPVASRSYVLDTVAPLISAAGIDISDDTGSSASDFRTKESAQTITATLSTTLAPGDILEGSVDGGATWEWITESVSGTAVNWAGATLSGTSAVQFRVKDLAGNIGSLSSQAYVLDTASTTISNIDISADTGSSNTDFVTNTASQTITATLGSALEFGEILEGSVNGGVTWTDITGSVAGTSVTWTGAALAGSDSIKLRTTDVAGNTSVETQNYVLDSTPATTTASAIDISSDTGVSSNDFVTKDDTQTITATLSTALVTGEILEGRVTGAASWTDITSMVSGTTLTWAGQTLVGSDTIELRVTDLAGNVGVVSSQNYVLDQTGTTASGIDISDDTGSSDSDFITNVASQTITATLGATLQTGDLVEGSVDNGTTWTNITGFVTGTTVTWPGLTLVGSNTIKVKVTDAAGNVGTVASQAFVIDTTAATTTVSAIGLSADTGALTTDRITKNPGPQTVTATLSAPLATGEVLEGSLDGGVTWTDVTFAASGTSIAWSSVALSPGVNDIRLRVTDAAGNVGIPSIQAYELDTTAPLTTVSVTSISNDTGTSASDFLTYIPGQSVTVAFSAPLAVGEFVEVSLDGGSTWQPYGGTAGATTHSFGVTLSGSPGTVTSADIQVRVTDVAGNGGLTGIQSYVLDMFAPVTTATNIDLSADTGASSSDFETKQAAQTITATLTTPLASGDILQGSVDGGANWTDITNKVSGTIVTWTGATLSGSSAIVLRVVDEAGNIGAGTGQSYVLDTVGATTVSGIGISADTGSSASDLVTNVAAQTVTATLSSPLLAAAGEILEGSVDGGATWTPIYGSGGSTAVNWTGVTLSGSSSIQLRVTDVAGNVGVAGSAAYVVDTTAATTTVSQIDISADTGTLATDFLTNEASQDITATLSTALLAGEVLQGSVDAGATWTDITPSVSGTAVNWVGATLLSGVQSVTSSSIQMRVLDVAGNAGVSSTQAYVVDTQYTTISGIAISSDTGTSSSDYLTQDAAQTVTATLSAPLLPGEVLEMLVDGGTVWTNVTSSVIGTAVSAPAVLASGSNSVQLRLSPDAAGNRGYASQAYELDTTPPATTISGIDIASDSGADPTDFVTNVASQTITATLSSALATGEILEGSVDGGASWSDITTGAVSGTAVSWATATLSGSSSIQLRVTDAAGNTGSVASEAYELDTTAPTTTVSAIDIASDSGADPTDFVTNVASQTITATLSSALATGEILEGSVDGGASWSDITTGAVSGTAVSWATATLSGSSSIQLRVTDAAGNTGSAASKAYVLDTTAPGVSGIDIASDSGTLATDFLTNVASQIVTATLNTALAAGEVLEGSVDGGTTWTNITASVTGGTAVSWSGVTLSGSSTIQLRVTDLAGNVGSTSQAYVLDTVAPTTTLSGVDISADTGTSAGDFVTKVASQTVTATLSSALATGEILQGSVDGGTNWSNITAFASGTAVNWTGVSLAGSSSIQLRVMDAAGNSGAAFGQVYELDTVAPTTTLSGLAIGTDTGTSSSDRLTKVASQTVTATLSSALASGEVLEGSVDGGATWSDVTGSVTGTAVSWASANLAVGSNSISLRVTDAAGNPGSASSLSYELDVTAPTTTLSAIDISSDSGRSASDFTTNVASQTVTATLSSALVSGEVLEGSVDGGASWLNITAAASGTAVSWTSATLAGTSGIQLRVTDGAGNSGSAASQAYILDTVAPTKTLSGIDIAADSGTLATDFLTNVASQTITATLSSGLASDEILQGSVDDGVNWSDITASVSGTAVSWTGAALSGSSSIKLRVMDAAGNDGAAFGQVYVLDTVAPTTTLSGLAIGTDTGTSTSDRLTKVASQTVTATLSSALVAGEVLEGSVDGGATWSDVTSAASGTAVSWTSANLAVGSNSISLRVTDAAGNSGSASSLSYELDVTAPTTTLSAIDISSDSGRSASDFTTNVASQTVTATLSSALVSGEVLEGSVDGGASWLNITAAASGTAVSWTSATLAGTSGIQLRVTDGAGNSGSVASQAYILDTAAPTKTLSGIDIAADSGTLATDFLTNVASQTITATLSSGLASDEILQGSVDDGVNWSDITAAVSGTAVSWTGAALSGSSSIKLRVTDVAGNNGSVASQAYILDTSAPTKTLSGIDISSDSGTSATDFITKEASQTVTATLSSALATGEILQGSVDNGVNWSDITAAASGTAVSWTGATLAGNSSIQIRVTDAAGNSGAAFGQAYSLDTTAPSRTISGVDFSSDTGIDGDFVTTTRVQTISATLSGSLGSGDLLMGSLDGGSTWTDVTSFVSGSSFSWTGVSLNQGTNQLRLQVTDVAGNNGDLAIRAYELGGQIAVSTGGSSATSEASFNTDPNVDIRFAWIGSSSGEAVAGTDSNDFLALLGGDDAANGGAGNDVLDGGTGSNFLIGGAGVDRFFVDARGGQVTWSTIGDFDLAAGEEVSLWGWRDGVSSLTWVADAGARGWTGVTMQADIDGNGVNDTYITWTGLDFEDLPVPLATQTGDGNQLLWFF